MIVDRPFFFNNIREHFGSLSQSQVDGFNHLLTTWDTKYFQNPLSYLAYALATAWWETGRTMRPIEETGRGAGHAYGPSGYYGRGYVQLTWGTNYAKASAKLKAIGITADLVGNPALALDPVIAAHIMYTGMSQGWFTGKSFASYLPHDPVNARRIINGTDRAETIAGYYKIFLVGLRSIAPASAMAPAPAAADTGFWSKVHNLFSRKA